jgi:hypothetical protein
MIYFSWLEKFDGSFFIAGFYKVKGFADFYD